MASPIEKLPPHNVEAEEAVLGSILVDPGALDEVIHIVRVADFYREKNGWVYEACLSVSAVNQITVAQCLAQAGRLELVGGAGYLSLLVERLPTSLHAEHYAEIVARLSHYRRFIGAAGQIAAIGYAVEGDESEGYAKIRKLVDDLMPHGNHDVVAGPQELAQTIMDISSDWQKHVETVKFGYPNLDRVTGGMNGGDLVIVGARTTVGKSQILQEVALHNAYQGKCILFASLEMSRRQLLERQIVTRVQKDIVSLRNGKASPKDWEEIGNLAQALSETPLYVMCGSLSLESIGARAKTLRETKDLKLLCFDHVQFAARKLGKGYGDTLREKVGYTTNWLKSLAQELDIPVLAACQLNRVVESREGHRPMLADLQESGSIEQDADMVLLLHRPELYDKCKPDDKGVMLVKIAKDRQGGRDDVVRLKWQPRSRQYGEEVKNDVT